MEIYDVVKKLVGSITPIGETTTDNERFENLKVMCGLIENLITDLDDMSFWVENSCEFSVKRAVKYAKDFLDEIGIKNE